MAKKKKLTEKQKKKHRLEDLLISLSMSLGAGTVTWLILAHYDHMTELAFRNRWTSSEILNKAIEHFASQPFDIKIQEATGETWMYSGMVFGGLALASWLGYMKKYLKRHDEDTGGDARFMDEDDLKEWSKDKVAPLGVKKKAIRKALMENDGNMIYADNLFKSLDGGGTRINNNILCVGGAGTGKSRFLIQPNILQMNASFVITDPSGGVLAETGEVLKRNGYNIKVFNLVQMWNSDQYNPFHYLRDAQGVQMLVECIKKNTKGEDAGPASDPFWDNTMGLLLQALIFYLYMYCPKEEQNFSNIMKLVNACNIEPNEEKSQTDLLFDEIRKTDPQSIAVKQYDSFKLAAGDTLKSVLITVASRLFAFNLENVKKLTCEDTIGLTEIGDTKTALFIIIPDADSSYNFLVSMMYSQLFESLYYHASKVCQYSTLVTASDGTPLKLFEAKPAEPDRARAFSEAERYVEELKNCEVVFNERESRYDITLPADDANPLRRVVAFRTDMKDALAFCKCCKEAKAERRKNERLPLPIQFLLDEFANIGQIPNFDKILSTMRKYDMACTIIVQDLSQLQGMYDKKWGTIVGNCDSIIYLGGQNKETIEWFSQLLDKATKRSQNESVNPKSGDSSSYSETSVSLMSLTKIREMENDKCFVLIRGFPAFYGDKFKYEKHKRYKWTKSASSKNMYVIGDHFVQPDEDDEAKVAQEETWRNAANQERLLEAARNMQDDEADAERYDPKPATDENIKNGLGVTDLLDSDFSVPVDYETVGDINEFSFT